MANFSSTYPSIRPVFNADFSNAGRLDSRITFSRSDTPPTYAAPSAVHYWSNEKHLSSENLITQSSNYSVTPWLDIYDLTPTGGETAPDGSSNAWLLTPTAGTNPIRIQQAITLEATTAYTASCYMKAGTATHGFMSVRGTSSHYAQVTVDFSDPTNPSSSGVNFTSVSATSTAVGSAGWYKVVLNFTSSSTVTSERIHVSPTDGTGPGASGIVTWTSAGNETMYLWGVQLNTTGATVFDSPTTTQIARAYAPTLKSVSYAGQPRFEFSPTDSASAVMGESLGLLVEGQAQNLLTYSNDSTQWSSVNVNMTAASGIAPSGALEANLCVPSAATDYHWFYVNSPSFTSGTAYTQSVYVKAAGANYIQLSYSGSAFPIVHCNFDLANGTVGSSSGMTGAIQSVGNGWYRISGTVTATSSATAIPFISHITSSTSGRRPSTVGDGYSGYLVYGYQVEANSFASSYISSDSGSATTRAADSASMASSSLFTSGEHSVYWEGTVNGSTADPRLFELTGATVGNRIQVFHNDGNKLMIRTTDNGVTKASIQISETMAGNSKVVATLKNSEARLVRNGSTITSSTIDSFYSPAGIQTMKIGTNEGGSAQLDGHVKRVAYYSTALTQTQAESLTS